uniref:Uncharacterized protein n=1 Tax=Arundo donax TaxID=35708 RepID=A0A0A8Y2Z0_ARUDO
MHRMLFQQMNFLGRVGALFFPEQMRPWELVFLNLVASLLNLSGIGLGSAPCLDIRSSSTCCTL